MNNRKTMSRTHSKKQILLIGSGSITHNLAELSWQGDNSKVPEWTSTFRNTVVSKLSHQDYDGVLEWQTLPFVKRNHPSLEHFAPFHTEEIFGFKIANGIVNVSAKDLGSGNEQKITITLASISKVTSICGTPLGAESYPPDYLYQ